MRYLGLIAIATVLAGATGCATVVRGDKQQVRFETDPPGATVEVAGSKHTTPATVPLKRKDEHHITISKSGYRTVTFSVKATWDGASLAGAILPGGSVSVGADRASGADLAFYPLPKIKLEPATGTNADPIPLFQRRDQLLTKDKYEALLEQERQEALHKIIE